MKNICIDARMINSAGIGTYLKNILPFIVKKLSPTLILKKKDLKAIPWLDKSTIIDCDHQIYSFKEQAFFFKLPKYDLFWSPHFNVPFLPLRTTKRIVTIHDVFHLAFFSKLKLKEKIYAKLIYNKAVKKSDIIITDSKFSKGEILEYLNVKESKIHVINCAVDLDRFQKKPLVDSNFSKKYALRRPYFLFIGNLKPHKNLKVLFKAHKFLRDDFDLVVIGKKEGLINADLSFSDQKIDKTVHVFNDISDSEIPLFYQNAIAFVFPSLYEGFGLPILESMAMGCPVIGSYYASIPEVASDAAIYFNPMDHLGLVKQMKRIAYDKSLRELLIEMGLKRVRDFSWALSASEHIELFEELIS